MKKIGKSIPPEYISPYLEEMTENSAQDDPILLQFKPSLKEEISKKDKIDFQNDKEFEKTNGLIHRHKHKALLCPSWKCLSFCRFCFRRDFLTEQKLSMKELQDVFGYLEKHQGINEIILSGGDPFSLPDEELEFILNRLYSIAHIKIVRIHTRVFTHSPDRITLDTIKLLKSYNNLVIVLHVNHVKELTDKFSKKILSLNKGGTIRFFSHTVLLKKINNKASTLIELFEMLFEIGITPYYLYHCDPIDGIKHFRIPLEDGIEIYRSLWGQISGLALPKYILELPNGRGKLQIDLNSTISKKGKIYTFRNSQGELVEYIDDIE